MKNERDFLTDAPGHQALSDAEGQMESVEGSSEVPGLPGRAGLPTESTPGRKRTTPRYFCDLVRVTNAAKLERETERVQLDDASSIEARLGQAHSGSVRRTETERSAHSYDSNSGEVLGRDWLDTDSDSRFGALTGDLRWLLPCLLFWAVILWAFL